MKTWNETFDVLAAARSSLAAGQPCAIVVLTNVKGSAFRRPGAKLLIRADGSMTGNVSGGCLENDLRERALKAMTSGQQEMIHYNTGSDEDVIWGLGLGCDGELDLLLTPVTKPSWIDQMLKRMSLLQPFSLVWSTTPGPAREPSMDATSDAGHFEDPLIPPPDLIVIGGGDDAIPLVELAALAGFRVTVVDHRPGYLAAERFPRATAIKQLRPEHAAGQLPPAPNVMVVIKNHALEMDKKWAAYFSSTDVCYIGILGPKKRCALVKAGMNPTRTSHVYGPAGLDIGAEGAEQIAASIIAEILAVWSGRDARHLRERDGSIH